MALTAMPFFGPSLAARSNSTVSTPALVRCAAICAPITPAPSTAALRIRRLSAGMGSPVRSKSGWKEGIGSWGGRNEQPESGGQAPPLPIPRPEPRRGEANQVLGGALAIVALRLPAPSLDDTEVGHGVGEGAGDDIQPPVQFLLLQLGQHGGEGGGEFLQHVAVVVGQELAQALVVLGIGPRQDAHEG